MSLYTSLDSSLFTNMLMDECRFVTIENFFSQIQMKNIVDKEAKIISYIMDEINETDSIDSVLTNFSTTKISDVDVCYFKNTFGDFYVKGRFNTTEEHVKDQMQRLAMKARYQIADKFIYYPTSYVGKISTSGISQMASELLKINPNAKLIAILGTQDEVPDIHENVKLVKISKKPRKVDGKWSMYEADLDAIISALELTDVEIIANLKSKMNFIQA